MINNVNQRIRIGLMTLALGGALGIIALLMRGQVPMVQLDVDAWAEGVTGGRYVLAQVLYIFAYVIPFFGFWALYAWLSKIERVEKMAFWGFISSVVGTSLALPMLGIFSFISPLIAQRYLEGDTQLPEIINQVFSGPSLMVNLAGGVLYLLGTVLLGVAIWRSGLVSGWAGVLIALHGLLIVLGFSMYPVLLLSWVLIMISGLWLYVKKD